MNLQTTIEILAFGTHEGAEKGWDTRGRGRKGEYGFFSPNVEENLTFEQAVQKLNSPEQQRAIQRAKELTQQILGGGEVNSAVGDWKDGAENSSVIFSKNTDPDKLNYEMATLGSELNQKSVISFVKDKDGDDTVWTLRTPKSMEETRDALDKAGINFRTLVPAKGGTTIHVFDQGTQLGDNITQAAKNLGSEVEAMFGKGQFIGGDSREEGQQAYRKIIEGYHKNSEAGHSSENLPSQQYGIPRRNQAHIWG